MRNKMINQNLHKIKMLAIILALAVAVTGLQATFHIGLFESYYAEAQERTVTTNGGNLAPQKVSYEIADTTQGYATGTVTITPPANVSTVYGYTLYWGDDNGKLSGYSAIATVSHKKLATDAVYKIGKTILIPPSATRLMVYAKLSSSESTDYTAVSIDASEKIKESKLLYTYQTISDLHTNTTESQNRIRAALTKIKTLYPDSEGIFTDGDNVDNGKDTQWDTLKGIVSSVLDGSNIPIHFTAGNHDFNLQSYSSSGFEKYRDIFLSKTGYEKTYYTTELSRATAISLGTDQKITCSHGGTGSMEHAEYSDTEMAWFKEELEKAAKKGGPIIILVHQPFKDTVCGTLESQESALEKEFGVNFDEDKWGLEQDAELRAIIKNYPQAIVYSGHTHRSFDCVQPILSGEGVDANFVQCSGVTYTRTDGNSPLWAQTDSAIKGTTSQGLFTEVYEDYILLKGYNFTDDNLMSYAQFMLPITSPVVEEVTVTPQEKTIKPGEEQTLLAAVVGNNNPAETVTWKVEGNNSQSTVIDDSGKLTVAEDETAETLTVTATSTVDPTKSGSAVIAIGADPTVTEVKITPEETNILKGNTWGFKATVTGENNPDQGVTWKVEGASSADTKVDSEGNVTVGSDETAETLTLTATSTADPTKSGTATIHVTVAKPIVVQVDVSPKNTVAVKGKTKTFSAEVFGVNDPPQDVTWEISGASSADTSISSTGILTLSSEEVTGTVITVKATSVQDPTISGTATLTVSDPVPVIVHVGVEPESVSLKPGTTQSFTATVDGFNDPSQSVSWSVSGAKSAQTKIDENGFLTVGSDETASSLTVKAASTVTPTESGTATVQIVKTELTTEFNTTEEKETTPNEEDSTSKETESVSKETELTTTAEAESTTQETEVTTTETESPTQETEATTKETEPVTQETEATTTETEPATQVTEATTTKTEATTQEMATTKETEKESDFTTQETNTTNKETDDSTEIVTTEERTTRETDSTAEETDSTNKETDSSSVTTPEESTESKTTMQTTSELKETSVETSDEITETLTGNPIETSIAQTEETTGESQKETTVEPENTTKEPENTTSEVMETIETTQNPMGETTSDPTTETETVETGKPEETTEETKPTYGTTEEAGTTREQEITKPAETMGTTEIVGTTETAETTQEGGTTETAGTTEEGETTETVGTKETAGTTEVKGTTETDITETEETTQKQETTKPEETESATPGETTNTQQTGDATTKNEDTTKVSVTDPATTVKATTPGYTTTSRKPETTSAQITEETTSKNHSGENTTTEGATREETTRDMGTIKETTTSSKVETTTVLTTGKPTESKAETTSVRPGETTKNSTTIQSTTLNGSTTETKPKDTTTSMSTDTELTTTHIGFGTITTTVGDETKSTHNEAEVETTIETGTTVNNDRTTIDNETEPSTKKDVMIGNGEGLTDDINEDDQGVDIIDDVIDDQMDDNDDEDRVDDGQESGLNTSGNAAYAGSDSDNNQDAAGDVLSGSSSGSSGSSSGSDSTLRSASTGDSMDTETAYWWGTLLIIIGGILLIGRRYSRRTNG